MLKGGFGYVSTVKQAIKPSLSTRQLRRGLEKAADGIDADSITCINAPHLRQQLRDALVRGERWHNQGHFQTLSKGMEKLRKPTAALIQHSGDL